MHGKSAARMLLALLCAPVAAKRRKRKAAADPKVAAAAMQYHQRGTMAHVQGDHEGAKREFRSAITLKPDFAYAYFRLAFVMHEQEQQEKLRRDNSKNPLKPPRPTEDPVPVFRHAIALDGRDEMAYYSLGQTLKDRLDLRGAAEVFATIASRLNPQSAQAYWALGKVHAMTRDEWEANPDDEDDPERFYELANALQPETFFADGSRVRLIEPMTPEREAALDEEAQARRESFLSDIKADNGRIRYAGEGEGLGPQTHSVPTASGSHRGRGKKKKD